MGRGHSFLPERQIEHRRDQRTILLTVWHASADSV
jgi:hypothetical protein